MKKCIKCRQQIPDDCEVCTYCGQWQEQIPIENESDKIDNGKIDIDEIENVGKKKRKKILIPVISVVLVVAIFAVIFICKVPQKYFGDFFAEPSVVAEEADNDNGLRFNFDIMGLQQRYTDVSEKLALDKTEYRWLEALLETVDDNYQLFGVDSTYYSYKNSHGDVEWWINIFEEHSSQKVCEFEICMRISENERDDIDEVMQNHIKLTLSALNPELGIIKINELAEELENSKKFTADGYKTLLYNNVYYRICDNPYGDFYALVVQPLTEPKYDELTEGNTEPIEMSDQEYYNKIINVLKNTSFCEDYLPDQLSAGACQDMSYGELIALMFESPDISVDRTGNNSCTVTVTGKYRSTPGDSYNFNGTVYIEFSDVEAGICTLSGSYGFKDLAKYFALSY